MNIKAIKSEEDYTATLKQIESLMNAKPNTLQMDELEVLTSLIENYEVQHYALDKPVDANEKLSEAFKSYNTKNKF